MITYAILLINQFQKLCRPNIPFVMLIYIRGTVLDVQP